MKWKEKLGKFVGEKTEKVRKIHRKDKNFFRNLKFKEFCQISMIHENAA